MKKILFSFLVLHLISALNIYSQQSGWVWQNPLPQGNDLSDIFMFNSGTGYCRSYYSILKTTNSGTNWHIIYNQEYIGDIFFINDKTGFHCQGANLFKTTSGGINWTLLSEFPGGTITMLNETNGYLISPYRINWLQKYALYKTSNGGVNWFSSFNDTTIAIVGINFPTEQTGYLAGNSRNAKFLKTINGGINWDSIPIHGLREVSSLYFLNNLTGYISGTRSHTGGPCLLRTTSGGMSWDSINFQITAFSNIKYLNINTGYANSLTKTTNGGVNWFPCSNYQAGLYSNDYCLIGSEYIYACGYKGQTGKSSNGGANWVLSSSGFYGYLYSIKFFDENTGIASGNRSEGIYLRTTNGGQTWDTNSVSGYYLESIVITDENTAYIAGSGKILKTTNRGASFDTLKTYSGSGWSDVSFPNKDTGYCVYKYSVIDKTTNGGLDWFNIQPWGNGEYFTICFINGTTGFYGGSKVFKTTNGGTTWLLTDISYLTGYYINRIRFINNKLYLLGMTRAGRNGAVITSTDAGITWNIDTSIISDELYDISVPIPNLIFIIGYRSVYKSINNSPWEKQNFYTSGGWCNSISFVNEKTGFISTYEGGILKTTTGGEPIFIEPTIEIPTTFYLFQNYPNPFNPVTTIRYGLPNNSFVKLKIYDILGRLVKELYNGEQEAGNHSIIFDGSAYASGVYFCTLETPEFTQSQKMVLLK